MNDSTHLNAGLFSESRGKKDIPVAVFAVVLVHVGLFLVLLIAAGCRARTRATRNLEAPQAAAPVQTTVSPQSAAATEAARQASLAGSLAHATMSEPVMAEPVLENAVFNQPAPAARETSAAPQGRVYVVQPGDTVEKIAKRHRTTIKAIRSENKLKNDMIRPGQKLRVSDRSTKSQA